MSDKKTLKDWVLENENLTDEFSENINNAFFDMVENPTDKKINAFKTIRDSLIVAYLLDLLDNLKKQLKESNLIGFNEAVKQLNAKNITKIVNKKLTKSKILKLYKSKVESVISDISFVTNGIKVNSDRAINDIKKNLVDSKKTISTEIISTFQDYGITYFTDGAGRRQKISNYVKIKTLTALMDIQRSAFFNEAIARGVDLVRIIHLNIHPECPLCTPYTGKVLSIQGKSNDYETVIEAMDNGLFHEYCDHIAEALELAPTNINEEDKIIKHSEENKKRKHYNNEKGYRFNI